MRGELLGLLPELYQETGQCLRQNRLAGPGRTYGIFLAFAPFEEEDD
ncbi:MAG: hypothetical protein P8Y13_00920 [Deinococcales bacterium]